LTNGIYIFGRELIHHIGFGLFEVDLSTFELYKRGVSIHVQDQPFRINPLAGAAWRSGNP
jgi:hypothetical protein